jgi:hypothetical protein
MGKVSSQGPFLFKVNPNRQITVCLESIRQVVETSLEADFS